MSKSRNISVPSAIDEYLAGVTRSLQRREIQKIRLTPLVLQRDAAELLSRRRSLFNTMKITNQPYGYSVYFQRKIRGKQRQPDRTLSGDFDLLCISSDLLITASTLQPEENRQGPYLLAQRAYPIAKRPFIASRVLRHLLESIASTRDLCAVSVDAMGYDRDSGKFRRDLKRQPVENALVEMSEQGRQVHRIQVAFVDKRNREPYRASFDRNGAALIRKGSAGVFVKEFILPAVEQALGQYKRFDLPRCESFVNQKMIQLTFRNDPFSDYAGMHALCRAVREEIGLSVSVVHLNPYLQAQVLDFLSGSAVEMLVMDSRTVTLVPRSAQSQSALERVTSAIFHYFGEASSIGTPVATAEEQGA